MTSTHRSHEIEVSPKSWVMSNRVGFPRWMTDTFKYEPLPSDPRGLYVHQRFVRDYLQPASPYRGLLLYHGLGVGKTCASIAIADVMRPPDGPGQVYVMLPAFLHGTFIEEVRKCGDYRFKPEQSWTAVNGGFESSPHGKPFEQFSSADQDAIKQQIDVDITTKYNIVHYNGLSVKMMHALCDGPINTFDDSVVIIDEAPNVISRVMGGKLFANVYQRIMDAVRCKIVLLSGTPLVNIPLELAFIANLTHGYIRQLNFSSIKSTVDILSVKSVLELHPSVDHVSSEVLADGTTITVSLLPNGFVKGEDQTVTASPDTSRPLQLIQELLDVSSLAAGVRLRDPVALNRFLLPIELDRFNAAFIHQDETHYNVHNKDILVQRLLGNISVFSSTDPKLMPQIKPARVMRVEMSDWQFEEYLIQRDIERRKERAAARFAAVSGKTDDDANNVYRSFSRSVCNFVFPKEVKRPLRRDLYRTLGHGAGEGDGDGTEQGDDEAGDITSKRINRIYDQALDAALALIDRDKVALLSITGKLGILSPKYMMILKHLMHPDQKKRLAIIYSQFRRVEGLGLLRLVLIANGFAELKITKRSGVISVTVIPADANRSAPRFIVYDNEDIDASSTMLKIFNSKLSSLPSDVANKLSSLMQVDIAEQNRYGAIARLLLISQSGSEGISTRNVREVHVIEPFWHANRILQVVGRAARANSHEDLPPRERTVDVFVYAATFTPFQSLNVTITKLDKRRTSDEHVLAVATRKRVLLDLFTDMMRRSAVDCVLHHPNSAVKRCFQHNAITLSKGDTSLSFQTDLDIDIATQGRLVRLVPFTMADGRAGLADPLTGDVFDTITDSKRRITRHIGRRRPSSITRFQKKALAQ